MLLKKLLEHFDVYETLHIEVNTVRDQLIDMGVQDEIRFHFVDIKTDVLRGLLFRYSRHEAPYSEPTLCSEICIAESLDDEWARLVAVKELVHITDTEEETAQSEQAVEKLIERLAQPYEVRKETASSSNDKAHFIFALAVLVPKECRILLRKLRNEGKITDTDAAKMAKIPERYAEFVLSDDFEEVVEVILANGNS